MTHGESSGPSSTGVRAGSLPVAAFDRWLEQDRLFVETLTRARGLILAGARGADLALLADGVASPWPRSPGSRRSGPTGDWVRSRSRSATATYQAHLVQMAAEPHAVALATMWAVEAAYLEAWRTARPGAPAYRPFVEHWISDAFATADHEAAFWAMTNQ